MTPLLTAELKPFAESRETASCPFRRVQAQDQNSLCTVEAIRVRAETMTPLLKEILEVRPPPHWGINE